MTADLSGRTLSIQIGLRLPLLKTDPFFDSDKDPSHSKPPFAAWTDCHWYRRLALPSADEQRDRITDLNEHSEWRQSLRP